MKIKGFSPNNIIRILISGDTMVWAGVFFNSAISAIYLGEALGSNATSVIAVGYAIFLISRSLPQFLIAKYLDDNKGFLDEVFVALIGAFLWGASYLFFIYISEAWHLYAVSILAGIGSALYIPAWRKTFAKFLDKGMEAKENAFVDSLETAIGALATVVGAKIVEQIGSFKPVYLVLGIMTIIGGLVVFSLANHKRINSAH